MNVVSETKIMRMRLKYAEDVGMKKGISQRNIEIAKTMISEGFDTDTIIKITILNKEILAKL